MRHVLRVIRPFLVLACVFPVFSAASDQGWPRQYTDGNARLTLYQPQVDSWVDFKKLAARFAVSLAASRRAAPVWGTLSIDFGTSVDRNTRSVTFNSFTVID